MRQYAIISWEGRTNLSNQERDELGEYFATSMLSSDLISEPVDVEITRTNESELIANAIKPAQVETKIVISNIEKAANELNNIVGFSVGLTKGNLKDYITVLISKIVQAKSAAKARHIKELIKTIREVDMENNFPVCAKLVSYGFSTDVIREIAHVADMIVITQK